MAPQTLAVDSTKISIPVRPIHSIPFSNRPSRPLLHPIPAKPSFQLIDFSKFLDGSPTDRVQTAKAILTGFQTAGFIYLSHLPIPPSRIAAAFTTSASFFAKPQSAKDAVAWTTPEANRGYSGQGREKVSTSADRAGILALKAAVPDIKESLEIGREGDAAHPNNWPAADPAFKTFMLAFFDECKALHVEVMRAIAVAMGLDEAWFDAYTDAGDNTLRLLHYPAVAAAVFRENSLQVRAGEHTDYGSITLLFQDQSGGLQVKAPDGTFVDATPIPGTVVVNAGDLLARWSNDTIRSTLHRVVQPPGPVEGDEHPARYSIAYFCNPNYASFIDAIPGTYGEEGKRYEGINSGEYIVGRLAATY